MSVLIPIFMYHHVVPESELPVDRHLHVTPETLRRQIKFFRLRGYSFLTLSQAWEKIEKGEGGRHVVLTFDDMYNDFYYYAFSVLAEEGITATAFAITDFVKGLSDKYSIPNGKLGTTASQLKEIDQAGIEIGSHTMTHREMTTLNDNDLSNELKCSRDVLADALGHEIKTFCYPRGRFSTRVAEAVEEAGYTCAVSTMRGNLHEVEDRYCLKRIRAGQEHIGLKLYYSSKIIYDYLHRKRSLRERERLQKADTFAS